MTTIWAARCYKFIDRSQPPRSHCVLLSSYHDCPRQNVPLISTYRLSWHTLNHGSKTIQDDLPGTNVPPRSLQECRIRGRRGVISRRTILASQLRDTRLRSIRARPELNPVHRHAGTAHRRGGIPGGDTVCWGGGHAQLCPSSTESPPLPASCHRNH